MEFYHFPYKTKPPAFLKGSRGIKADNLYPHHLFPRRLVREVIFRQIFWLSRSLLAFPVMYKWRSSVETMNSAIVEIGITAAGPLRYYTGFPIKPVRAPE